VPAIRRADVQGDLIGAKTLPWRRREMQFLLLLLVFAVIYFGLTLPVFQLVSRRARGRKFVIRLGTPWRISDAEHRWDVLLSFVSFALALGVALFLCDFFFPLGEFGGRTA
jgi:hypothetical protein